MSGPHDPNIPQLRTSDRGLALTRAAEGLELTRYRDSGGVATIGYGHTRGVFQLPETIDRATAERLLREDMAEAEDTMRAYLPEKVLDELPQPAWDALADFVFNLGPQAFRNPSTGSLTGLARVLEARDYANVPFQFRRWVYDNGKKLAGLVTRRDACCVLWNSADWGSVK